MTGNAQGLGTISGPRAGKFPNDGTDRTPYIKAMNVLAAFLPFLITIALAVTVLVLVVGVLGFAMSGDFNRKYANKLMRARVIAQAVAVGLLALFAFAFHFNAHP